MSVLIKGMKMPEKCGLCDLFHAESPMHCTVVKGHKTVGAPYGMPRPEWCPLVEVPTPHGRLIEEPKSLSYAGLAYISRYDDVEIAEYFRKQIKNQPTVIEAEE